jgi:ribosomal protein S17E
MEIKVSKVYRVNGVEYNSKEEAVKATAREILEKHFENGLEALIENAEEVRKALNILSK